jgi:subtilisin family serine protease
VTKLRDCRVLGLILLVVLIPMSVAVAEGAIQRLDPSLRMLVLDSLLLPEAQRSIQGLLDSESTGLVWTRKSQGQRIELLVKLNRTFRGSSLHGIRVKASIGSIIGISATVQQILTLLEDQDVVYIEQSRRMSATLDVSVPATTADSVHSASPAIMGAGVIVGATDTGIDYTHLDFRYDSDGDGFEESSRILGILDQSFGFFGIEYTRQDIETDLANGHGANDGIVREKDTDGHGTHVMAVAAGDGSSSDQGFIGVAPEAWIVMVKTTYYTSDILAGVEYIFDLADTLGLPAVVNLSLGGHEGAHDGSSLFEQGMDDLVQGPGRVIVVSAGNEGDQAIHASDTLLGDTSSFRMQPDGWDAEIDMWYTGSSQFTIAVNPPSGAPIVVPQGTDSGIVQTAFGSVRVDNAASGVNANNGDREVFIRFSGLSSSDSWRITVTDTGGSGGKYDAWIVSGSAEIIEGDSSSTIDEPGNARDVITVGSFNTKAVWPSLSGDQNFLSTYPLNVLSSFSSQGPTRDGRTKPEICAPGAWIGAALSSDALWQGYLVNPDGVHTMELGTSMAAPHVSGAAALLLSINPQLTAEDVRALLTDAAFRDGFTGAVPNNRWGWGKLDIAAAVANVGSTQPPPVDPPPSDGLVPEIQLDENPVEAVAQFAITMPAGTTWAEIRIYSVNGTLVYIAAIHPSTDRLEWSLITNRGESVASGLYLYVLKTDRGVSEVGKLVIAR